MGGVQLLRPFMMEGFGPATCNGLLQIHTWTFCYCSLVGVFDPDSQVPRLVRLAGSSSTSPLSTTELEPYGRWYRSRTFGVLVRVGIKQEHSPVVSSSSSGMWRVRTGRRGPLTVSPRGGSIRPYEGIFHAVRANDPAPEMPRTAGIRWPRPQCDVRILWGPSTPYARDSSFETCGEYI